MNAEQGAVVYMVIECDHGYCGSDNRCFHSEAAAKAYVANSDNMYIIERVVVE